MKDKIRKYFPKLVPFVGKMYMTVLVFIDKVKLVPFKTEDVKDIIVDDIHFKLKIVRKNGFVDEQIYLHGVYEAETLRTIKKYINSDSVCLDIGGNIGQHAMFMAKVAQTGAVYVFEPIKRLADQIQESVVLNDIKNIHIENIALSNTKTTQSIYTNTSNAGMSSLSARGDVSIRLNDVVQVDTLDNFWNKKGAIDFMKIDVEGYEYHVLQGAVKTIEQCEPTILLEFSPKFYEAIGVDSDEFVNFIFSLGYKIYIPEKNMIEVSSNTKHILLNQAKSQVNILLKKD